MRPLSYAGYRFPPEIIQHAIWLYLRFTLSFRDVEELLAERGIDVSHETIRRWVAVFGPMIARRLRAMRPKPHTIWHLDEMFVSIGGKRMYLWRAVDAEGEVLDCLALIYAVERSQAAGKGFCGSQETGAQAWGDDDDRARPVHRSHRSRACQLLG